MRLLATIPFVFLLSHFPIVVFACDNYFQDHELAKIIGSGFLKEKTTKIRNLTTCTFSNKDSRNWHFQIQTPEGGNAEDTYEQMVEGFKQISSSKSKAVQQIGARAVESEGISYRLTFLDSSRNFVVTIMHSNGMKAINKVKVMEVARFLDEKIKRNKAAHSASTSKTPLHQKIEAGDTILSEVSADIVLPKEYERSTMGKIGGFDATISIPRAEPSEIKIYFQDQLTKKGWRQTKNDGMGQISIWSFSKGNITLELGFIGYQVTFKVKKLISPKK